MGLLSDLIIKGVATAARNSTIKTVSNAAVNVVAAKSMSQAQKEDAVVKNGKLYIKPTRSSEHYLNENALDITKELLGVGFENINLMPIKKLGERSIKKYGKVSSISINGNKDFLGLKKIPSTSHIIIEFLDFKDGLNDDIYKNVRIVKAGTIHSVDDLEDKKQNNTNNADIKRFCVYCGAPIAIEDAKFCSVCGRKIE